MRLGGQSQVTLAGVCSDPPLRPEHAGNQGRIWRHPGGMSQVGMRIQRFNQQSYLGPSTSDCENYFEPHPAPEKMVSLLKQDGVWHQQAWKEQRPDIEASRRRGICRACFLLPDPKLLLASFCRAQPHSSSSKALSNPHP